MGYSKANVFKILASALIFLLLLFAFIFLGITAFTTGSTFGSIINSLLPISGGSILGKNKKIDLSKMIETIKENI